jgi:hypothetical protein
LGWVIVLFWKVGVAVADWPAAGLGYSACFVGAAAVVCFDLGRRARGVRSRRWFGGAWSQLITWNVWNAVFLGQLHSHADTRFLQKGFAIVAALLVLASLGKEQELRAVPTGPNEFYDRFD